MTDPRMEFPRPCAQVISRVAPPPLLLMASLTDSNMWSLSPVILPAPFQKSPATLPQVIIGYHKVVP